VIQVVAFTRALTDAGKHRNATVRLGDVVDQFLDQHRLAHAGAAEQADLAALQVGRQQIHNLDAGDKDFGRGRLVFEARRIAVDGVEFLRVHRPALIDRLADNVDDATQRFGPDRHTDRRAGIGHFLAAHHAIRAVHGNAAHGAFTQFLRHFQHHVAVTDGGDQRALDVRQFTFELHVHNGAKNLCDAAYIVARHSGYSFYPEIEIRWLRRRR